MVMRQLLLGGREQRHPCATAQLLKLNPPARAGLGHPSGCWGQASPIDHPGGVGGAWPPAPPGAIVRKRTPAPHPCPAFPVPGTEGGRSFCNLYAAYPSSVVRTLSGQSPERPTAGRARKEWARGLFGRRRSYESFGHPGLARANRRAVIPIGSRQTQGVSGSAFSSVGVSVPAKFQHPLPPKTTGKRASSIANFTARYRMHTSLPTFGRRAN